MNRTRKLSVLTTLLILAVFVAGWFLLVAPKRSDAIALQDKVTKQEEANQTTEAQIVTLQALAKDLPSKTAELAALHRQLPADPALPTLIRNLTAAARTSGVNLVSLAPSTPVPLTPSGAASAPVDPKAAPSEAVFEISLALAIEGNYFELEHFLSKLEALQRAMLVTGFDVAVGAAAVPASTVDSGTAADSDADGLTMAVKAKVFMRSQPTAVAPAAGAAAAPAGTASPAPTAGATPAATGAATPLPTPTN